MRTSLIATILICGTTHLCAAQAQHLVIHTPHRVANRTYADVLANGTYADAVAVLGHSPTNYTIRLWSVTEDGGCVEGTEAICSADYYLTFQWQGEGIEPSVFSLGSYGELTLLSMTASGGIVTFIANVANYPVAATPLAPGLVRHTRKIAIRYSEDSQGAGSLTVTPVP